MAGEQEHGAFMHGQDVLTLLNRNLANEMNTMLMYMACGLMAKGTDSNDVRQVTTEFARQDFQHVEKLAARVVELEGVPELMPRNFEDNASIEMKMPADGEVPPMLKDALENEMQSVIEYKNQIRTIAFSDPATRLLLEGILAEKEHQAESMRNLLGV